MWFVRHEPWRTRKPRRDASASGTTDFVTWEFIPLYQPPWVLVGKITLTDKGNKINVVCETRTVAEDRRLLGFQLYHPLQVR